MRVELSKEQIENLLIITDRSQIAGQAAEMIVELKQALKKGLLPEKEGK